MPSGRGRPGHKPGYRAPGSANLALLRRHAAGRARLRVKDVRGRTGRLEFGAATESQSAIRSKAARLLPRGRQRGRSGGLRQTEPDEPMGWSWPRYFSDVGDFAAGEV